MDKLNTELYGGFPFDLDDWRWEMDAHRKAFGAIGNALSGSTAPLIMSGMVGLPSVGVMLPGPGVITPGWMAWGGELLEYTGGMGNPMVPPALHYFTLDVSLDPSGVETFEDGSTQNAYMKRRLKVVADGVNRDADTAYASLEATPRLFNVLHPSAWTLVTPEPSYAHVVGSEASYRIEPGGVLRYRGALRFIGGSWDEAFKMPTWARPSVPSLLCPVACAPGVGPQKVVVMGATRPNPGMVGFILPGGSIAPGDIVYLDGVTYAIGT